ncbi:hypothetical protein [uncultured Zoogloea sp.]|jgi:hypothetical protein|uniref:hypothetical protein n=1 Tax=uncultured Zoogloea sp. TaxID=160237 RepID=UPI00260561E3|nr:hypothetical protein [uncultured Zoogloea sp.]
MKRLIATVLLAASLGGCIVAPPAPGYYGHRHPRYVEPPVVVVPPYRGHGGPRHGWDRDRGGDYGRRW